LPYTTLFRSTAMAVDRRREALQVVVEEEHVDEGPALIVPDERMPRPGPEEEEPDAGRGQDGARLPPLPCCRDVAGHDQAREDEAERALGEGGQGQEEPGRGHGEPAGDPEQAQR